MDINLNFVPLNVLGYIILDIPPDLYNNLSIQIENLKNKNFKNGIKTNEKLHSVIRHEYKLEDDTLLEKFLLQIAPQLYTFYYQPPKNLKLNDTWINFQKKYEYNPIHNHFGKFSFVIWMNIPYDLDQERNFESVKYSNEVQLKTTAFNFLYTNPGQTINFMGVQEYCLQIDKSFEGKMIIFESNLPHGVYPFYTSDEFRISIAGNLVEKIDGN